MAGCGVTGFMTSKIFWAYNGADPFPYNNFMWEGIDGSQVMAGLYNGYGHFPLPNQINETWNTRAQRNDVSGLIYPIGWGDGGGGATRMHLEFARRAANLEGVPRLRMTTPGTYFSDMQARGAFKNTYVGELYFQAHRGTYTSQAKTKKGNRQSEFALREAELWNVAARALTGMDFGPQTLDEDWKIVLLHQFHDGLPGSSIQRVYEEIERDHAAVIARANASAQSAATALLQPAPTGAAVFNSLSWPRKALVTVPVGADAGAGTQQIGGATYAMVDLPACGWAPLAQTAQVQPGAGVSATANTLENEFLRVQFNSLGEISSILDKQNGREVTAGLCNAFKMYKDVPVWFDAWDIDAEYKENPVALPEQAELTLLAAGPLVGQLQLTRKLSDLSELTQTISLRRGSRRIDFETTVNWQESHKLLKVAFPVAIHANEATHEVQFGHLKRPNHASRPYDADRFEVSNHKWSALSEADRGVAVLNDCKYGLNVEGNSINLTLLKSPLAPDMRADKGIQTFSYAFYPWNGSFADSGVVQEAYDLNIPALVVAGAACAAPVSLFALDRANIIIEAVKPAEDGSPAIVLRLYEAMHAATRCELSTSLPVRAAAQTDMLENQPQDLLCQGGKIALEFRPFEIKTVRLDL
jgi:alpha-mannosidase